jgi:hypothetical protein
MTFMLRELSFHERQQISGRVDRLRIAENRIFDFMHVWYIRIRPGSTSRGAIYAISMSRAKMMMSQL